VEWDAFSTGTELWSIPDYCVYRQLLFHSQFAAWVYVHGNALNHATINVGTINGRPPLVVMLGEWERSRLFISVEINMNYDNCPKTMWFKRKKYGWGWTPSSREGWLVTILFLAAVYVVMQRNIPENPGRFSIELLFLVVIFIIIAYRTGEKPRWSWG